MTTKKTGRPTGRKVFAKTSNGRQTVEASAKDARGHIAGSRKSEVHASFDTQGEEKAMALGLKLKLQPSTLRSWFGAWKRGAGTKKTPATKPAAKKAASTKSPAATKTLAAQAQARKPKAA